MIEYIFVLFADKSAPTGILSVGADLSANNELSLQTADDKNICIFDPHVYNFNNLSKHFFLDSF